MSPTRLRPAAVAALVLLYGAWLAAAGGGTMAFPFHGTGGPWGPA